MGIFHRFSNSVSSILKFHVVVINIISHTLTGAEVFALNNFLCSLLIWLTAEIFYTLREEDRVEDIIENRFDDIGTLVKKTNVDNRLRLYILCGSLVSGLCLANQHSSFLLVVILILGVLVRSGMKKTGIFTLLFLVSLVGAFLVGISPYVYLIHASQNHKPGSWGNITTLQGYNDP